MAAVKYADTVGQVRVLDSSLKVIQVVDKANLIAEVEDLNVDVGAARPGGRGSRHVVCRKQKPRGHR